MRSHPRLLAAAAVALILYWLLSGWTGTAAGFLVAFDGGAVVFLASAWVMMARATPEEMRRRAEMEDEGRYAVLGFSAAAATAILFAIMFELHGVKDRASDLAGFQVALAVVTILLSWLFIEHDIRVALRPWLLWRRRSFHRISGNRRSGISRPTRSRLLGFHVFSFVVGMTFQVSDVQVEDHKLRREVLAHGVLAFFFNVAIVALTINIVAGLI